MGKRFIFYGGAREVNNDGSQRPQGKSHNWAFFHGAEAIRKSYSNFDSGGEMTKVRTAEEIVTTLNDQPEASILSVDIVSHGTPWTLNFSIEDDLNSGFYTSTVVRLLVDQIGRMRDDVNEFGKGSASFTDIEYKKFADDARVEFHGCNAANTKSTEIPVPAHLRDQAAALTLCVTVSKALFDAGRKNAYVIGHATSIGPIKTSTDKQDYRHGKRVVYHNGDVLFETTKKGHLSHDEIQKKIAAK
jgi:hypothetical protein